ncbi:MAG: dihydrofolate reductase family protein [Acidobacteriota bacterium]
MAERDLELLKHALDLATSDPGLDSTRLRNGAVVSFPDGGPVVRWSADLGVDALLGALRPEGERASGATLAVVVLDPLIFARPAVRAALDRSGVERVVACHLGPAPRGASPGDIAEMSAERLVAEFRSSGYEVLWGAGVEDAARLNWRHLTWRTQGRPAVTVKWAMSLDGRIATVAGDSQWISGPSGRQWALEQREGHDAILVGSGTVLADDPRLDRRLGARDRPIMRVVLDRRLRTPPEARLLTRGGPLLIYVGPRADAARRQRLIEAGTRAADAGGASLEIVQREPASPAAVLEDLHRRGVSSLLVEGGGQVAAAFIEAGLFDRIAVCCAPLLIGGQMAPGPLGGRGFAPLHTAPRLARFEAESRGEDFILTAFRDSCLPALSASVENF